MIRCECAILSTDFLNYSLQKCLMRLQAEFIFSHVLYIVYLLIKAKPWGGENVATQSAPSLPRPDDRCVGEGELDI